MYSHAVDSTDWLKNPGVLEALQLLKEQKKARFIGFSTHSNLAELINKAIPMNFYDVILTPFNYAYWDNHELINTLQTASDKGTGLIAMKTQCMQHVIQIFIRRGRHWTKFPNTEDWIDVLHVTTAKPFAKTKLILLRE